MFWKKIKLNCGVCSIYLAYKIHQLMKGLRSVLKVNTQYFELTVQKETKYAG